MSLLRPWSTGLVVVDAGLRVLAMNDRAEAFTTCRSRDIQGTYLSELFSPDFCQSGGALDLAISTGQRVGPVGTSLRTPAGLRPVLAGVTPLTNAEGQVVGYSVSIDDSITRPEDLQLNADVLASVSHELRGPLSNIKVYAELLQGSLDAEQSELRGYLTIIGREADRLAQLVTDFLDLSRLESGRLRPKKAEFPLGELVNQVLAELQIPAESCKVEILVDIPVDLAPCMADATLIAMAVRNLVGNAIKFSRAHGQIRIRVWEEPDWLRLSIKDDGVGIPEDAIPKLFSRFFQVPNEQGGALRGTGLGLALTKQAIAAHGGSVEVDSTLGKGSEFIVTLPRVPSGAR